MISRDIYPNGAERVFISDPNTGHRYFDKFLSKEDRLFGVKKGTGNGRGRTRGKPSKTIVNTKEIQGKLDDNSIGFLFRLSSLSKYDSGLISKRGKPLTVDAIAKEMDISRALAYEKVGNLIQAGVITKEPDGYHIHRKYITKG